MWGVFVFAFLLASVVANVEKSKVVRISQGDVKGYLEPEGDIFAFYNIPYASAPRGNARFKAPQPAPVWLQTFEAVDRKIICPQPKFGPVVPVEVNQQEDCLVANVFVPDTDEKNLPVAVVVHGGAFQLGLGNWLKLNEVTRIKSMIVVSFNYRLGIHGFLCLGTKNVPGNAGLKDQVALLRWVNKNIASFGGNPEDVTLLGYSAGAASVDLLMLSKAAEGLFNKVVPESGSSLAAFSMQSDPLENAKYFARKNNFSNVDDIYALEEFYKTASYEQLTVDAFIDHTDSTFVFSPCVERDVGEERILDDTPFNILKNNKYKKVPVLVGFANMEGLLRIDFFDYWSVKMNEKFSDFLPADLQFESEEQKEEVAKTIKEFYFGDKPVSSENILSYVDFFSDVIFTSPSLREIKSLVEGGHDQIYLYEYSFVDDDVPVVPHTNVRGANHCAQSMAIADGSPMIANKDHIDSDKYKKLRAALRTVWSNFITTGNPTPEGSELPKWSPVTGNNSPHMSFGDTIELKGSLLEQRANFWGKIYDQYYRSPVPPPTPPPKHSEL